VRAPIRLAFFIDDLGIGGTQTWLTLLVRALASRGFDMRVYVMRAIWHPENLRRLQPHADVEIIGEARLRAGLGLVRLARALTTWRADVVQTALPTSDMIGRTLGRLVGVPAIFSSIRGRNVDKPAWQRWLDRRTAGWAQAVVFNDRDAIPFAMRHEGIRSRQVVYIPNGVAVTAPRRPAREIRDELRTAAEATVIGTVARLGAPKSQEDLLRAFAVVRRRHPAAVLWLIGDGERRSALEQEARRLEIAAHVRMPGARDDVRDILESIDLFALPSRWEGMPNALMEAMAAGRPAVASDIDGIRELIRHGETGWRVPPGDVDVLARTMLDILADRERAAQVGRTARAHVERHFSLDRMAYAYETLYRQGVEARARRHAVRPP
jgi:glycosyltransferase involved in cell wall biosynthesis